MEQVPNQSRLITALKNVTTSAMEAPFDLEKAHRWFAVTCNNGTWDLLENEDRSPEDDLKLVHIAHASAFHWSQTGDEANAARAACMVANAHAAVKDGHAAMRHAEHCVQLTEGHPDKLADWDLAFAYDALARAHNANGDSAKAEKTRRQARELGDKISDPGDKEVFDSWWKNW